MDSRSIYHPKPSCLHRWGSPREPLREGNSVVLAFLCRDCASGRVAAASRLCICILPWPTFSGRVADADLWHGCPPSASSGMDAGVRGSLRARHAAVDGGALCSHSLWLSRQLRTGRPGVWRIGYHYHLLLVDTCGPSRLPCSGVLTHHNINICCSAEESIGGSRDHHCIWLWRRSAHFLSGRSLSEASLSRPSG